MNKRYEQPDDDPEDRDELVREHPKKPGVYDFDSNGPMLTDEDEAILDRIWDRIRRDREAKRQRDAMP